MGQILQLTLSIGQVFPSMIPIYSGACPEVEGVHFDEDSRPRVQFHQ